MARILFISALAQATGKEGLMEVGEVRAHEKQLHPLAALLAVLLLLPACSRGASFTGQGTPAPSEVPTAASSPTPAAIPGLQRVFIIMMENKEYGQVIGSAQAPYINQLAGTYASATQYYGVTHPSLPNYLAIVSGSAQGISNDCGDCTVSAANIVDQLEAHSRTWTAYMEDMPNPCFNGVSSGGVLATLGLSGYVRKHNPFMYFDDIRNDPARCNRVVPLSQFSDDLQKGQLADYVWITPNQQHDMHNGSVADGDKWLASFVPAILDSPAWQEGGVLFIIWDEGTTSQGCCGNASGGHVPALVIAARGKQGGYQSPVPYSHYSLLRTIEDAWGLGSLGHAADPGTQPMVDFFQ